MWIFFSTHPQGPTGAPTGSEQRTGVGVDGRSGLRWPAVDGPI